MSIGELRELGERVATELDQGARRHREAAIKQINAVAESVGLSLREILNEKDAKPAKRRAKTRGYIDPANPSNVWGGAGPRPAWLKSALAAGVPIDQLRAQG